MNFNLILKCCIYLKHNHYALVTVVVVARPLIIKKKFIIFSVYFNLISLKNNFYMINYGSNYQT